MTSPAGHYEREASIHAPAEAVFDFADDHARFSSHMSESSMMMAGSKMQVEFDAGKGQTVGSHIRLDGRVFGVRLDVDEVVTERTPPLRKTWETVGVPRLLVIGAYRMGFALTPDQRSCRLRVFIDFEYPSGWSYLLGRLLGGTYARWCVRQMIDGAARQFEAVGDFASVPVK